MFSLYFLAWADQDEYNSGKCSVWDKSDMQLFVIFNKQSTILLTQQAIYVAEFCELHLNCNLQPDRTRPLVTKASKTHREYKTATSFTL